MGKVGNIDTDRRGSALVEKSGDGHAKQPRGHSIGNAPEYVKHRAGQSYDDKLREHGGRKATEGTSMKTHKVANIDAPQGSSLLENCGEGHAKQPSGHTIGTGQGRRYPMGSGDRIGAGTSHGFGHPAHLRSGPLRMSGHSGAHRIGSRKK